MFSVRPDFPGKTGVEDISPEEVDHLEEDDGMITLHLDYLKKAYRKEKMRDFICLCAKYLKQVTGIPEDREKTEYE